MPKTESSQPIHVHPTAQTEAVITSIRKGSKIKRGPLARVFLDHVAGEIRAGRLAFTEHQLVRK